MLESVEIIENTWITMPDGRRLAARILMPVSPGPHPAILEYLPYRKRDVTAPRDDVTHGVFARAGYACVRVDIAGTGDSDGLFDDEYSEQELSDGEAVLAWIARQDWCDGHIGMIGISWGGFNGLQLACRRPPALKAVVSVASTTDRYADDIHYQGGCLLVDNMKWGCQMAATLSRPPDPELRPDWREVWLARMKNMPFLSAEWLRHPTRDKFWQHGSVCEDWSAICVPVLAITGWADAYVNAPLQLAENLDAPVKALLGPWEHRYAHLSNLGAADFQGEVLRWFDRWLKGAPNGAEDLPNYRTFMLRHSDPTMEYRPPKGEWTAEENWPSANLRERRYYLSQDGLGDQPGTGMIAIRCPADVGRDSGNFMAGSRIDNEMPGDQAADDAKSVCFETPALSAPLELLGRARLRIAFSVDKPVAQIVARLCDVAPDRVSQRITWRALNLTHHASHADPEPLEPGRVYHAEIALNECAYHLQPGHRLRLALSSSYWPVVWPAPEPCEISLHLEDCTLHLPQRETGPEGDPMAPGAARSTSMTSTAVLRPPASNIDRYVGNDGTVVLKTIDDLGSTENLFHGLIMDAQVSMETRIHPDHPASADFRTGWKVSHQRGEWQVGMESDGMMTSDAEFFYLRLKLRATEGPEETEVFVKEWAETIPRGFL